MIKKLIQLLKAPPPAPKPALPTGERVYAVGDIHGRLDLFSALISAIEADDQRRGPPAGGGATTIILLGDLVDRGPDSAGVLRLARQWQQKRPLRILMGNHEEMLLGALDDIDILRALLRHGGAETVLSFGVDKQEYLEASYETVQQMLVEAMGQDMIDFVKSFEDQICMGDYCFVHAGIRPGITWEEQKTQDLRWIREPFLSHEDSHNAVIVHGHTIALTPQIRENRIGIDTGAFDSGQLTALGLEGSDRWLIATTTTEGDIQTWLQPTI